MKYPPTDLGQKYKGLERFPGYLFGSDGSVWACKFNGKLNLESGE